MGNGVERDLNKALYWHTKAAEQGNVTAMSNVGANLMAIAMEKYGSVELVGKCPVPRALSWGRKAAEKGDIDAARIVAQLETAFSGVCANCGKQETAGSTRLNRCAKCKVMHYCGRKCQVEHWKAGHKVDCYE